MTTHVAAVRVPTPNAEAAQNARSEGRGLQNPERGFTLTLSNFEGPFDLLLTLISRRKLDITDVALAEVTDESSLPAGPLRRGYGASPWTRPANFWSPPQPSSSSRPRACYRSTANPLRKMSPCSRPATYSLRVCCSTAPTVRSPISLPNAGHRKRGVFPRAVALEERFAHALPELVLAGGAEEFARIAAAALSRQPAEPEPAAEEIVEELNEHLHVPVTTIAAEEHYLLHTLLDASGRELRFDELVRGAGDLEIAVVRFLALLELYKEGALHMEQEQPLGEILVRASATAGSFVIRPEALPAARDGSEPVLPESVEARETPEAEFTENGIDPEEERD